MNKSFTIYTDQLKRIITRVEDNVKKNPLALSAITIVVSDNDTSLRIFQKVGHDWVYMDEEKISEQ